MVSLLRRQWQRPYYRLPPCLLLAAQRPSLREQGLQDVVQRQRGLEPEPVCWARLLQVQEARVWELALVVQASARALGPVVRAMVRVTELAQELVQGPAQGLVRAREPVEVERAEAALGLGVAVQAVVESAEVVRVALVLVAGVQEALALAVAGRAVVALVREVLEQALGLAQAQARAPVQGRVQEPARAQE